LKPNLRIIYRLQGIQEVSYESSIPEEFDPDQNIFYSIGLGHITILEESSIKILISYDVSIKTAKDMFLPLSQIKVVSNYEVDDLGEVIKKINGKDFLPVDFIKKIVDRSVSHTRAYHYMHIKDSPLELYTIPMLDSAEIVEEDSGQEGLVAVDYYSKNKESS